MITFSIKGEPNCFRNASSIVTVRVRRQKTRERAREIERERDRKRERGRERERETERETETVRQGKRHRETVYDLKSSVVAQDIA